MKLRGDRCQCSGCGEYFNSTAAFDKHRRGEMTARKCLSVQEMRAKGWSRNDAGYWVTATWDKQYRFPASRDRCRSDSGGDQAENDVGVRAA